MPARSNRDVDGENVYESKGEQTRIIRRQFRGSGWMAAIFRGALKNIGRNDGPLLNRVRLAGQQRLVRVRRAAREHNSVGGDEIAGGFAIRCAATAFRS